MLKQAFLVFSLILTLTLFSFPAQTKITVSIPNTLSANPGATGVQAPVNVSDVTGLNIIGVDIVISYDKSVLTATGAILDETIATGGQVQTHIDYPGEGQITIGVTKENPPLSGSGVLVFILFDVKESPPTRISELSFAKADFNEEPADQITDGQITILPGDKRNVGTGTSDLTEGNGVPVDIFWDNDLGVNSTFAAIQFDSYPDVTTGLLSNFPKTYWEIWIANDDGDFTADVTFHYDNIGGISDEANLQLYMRGSEGQTWTTVTNITLNDEGDNEDGVGSITANNLNSFSQFILTSNDDDNSLPVTLSSFTAMSEGNAVTLFWRTETELNTVGFSIYRSEEKDGNYIKIGFVSSAGNTAMPTNYQFTDKKAEPGKTYFYYLQDVDITGAKNKNTTIKVVVPAKLAQVIPNQFRLLQNFPNPFNPETWIPFDLAADANVTIRIYSVKGQLVRQLDIGERKAGRYLDKKSAACWNGKDQLGQPVSSGLYFYTLNASGFDTQAGFDMIRRMVIVR